MIPKINYSLAISRQAFLSCNKQANVAYINK